MPRGKAGGVLEEPVLVDVRRGICAHLLEEGLDGGGGLPDLALALDDALLAAVHGLEGLAERARELKHDAGIELARLGGVERGAARLVDAATGAAGLDEGLVALADDREAGGEVAPEDVGVQVARDVGRREVELGARGALLDLALDVEEAPEACRAPEERIEEDDAAALDLAGQLDFAISAQERDGANALEVHLDGIELLFAGCSGRLLAGGLLAAAAERLVGVELLVRLRIEQRRRGRGGRGGELLAVRGLLGVVLLVAGAGPGLRRGCAGRGCSSSSHSYSAGRLGGREPRLTGRLRSSKERATARGLQDSADTAGG